jgi:hypothetical protein
VRLPRCTLSHKPTNEQRNNSNKLSQEAQNHADSERASSRAEILLLSTQVDETIEDANTNEHQSKCNSRKQPYIRLLAVFGETQM